MMATPQLEDVVMVASRFRRSANPEADYGQAPRLQDYIVSQLAADITLRLSRELASPNGNRAWAIVGPYGSGKSSFLIFVATWLSNDPVRGAAEARVGTVDGAIQRELRQARAGIGGSMVPVFVTGSRRPIGPAILSALHSAALRNASQLRDAEVYLRKLRLAMDAQDVGQDGEGIVELLKDFAARTRGPNRVGTLLIIDEMGKFLEYAAQNPSSSDIFLLQQIAEAADRAPEASLAVVTVLHQDFEEYANTLPASAQAEWAKVRGRYETITFLESSGHLLRLMAHAITRSTSANQVGLFASGRAGQWAKQANRLARGDNAERVSLLERCFPLNPLVALCLGPLFRLRLGQNERSLFSFLGSLEPGGFQTYLRTTRGQWNDSPYCLDHLYDYVVENTSARAGGQGRARIWAATEEAINRLPKTASELDSRILKAVAVLTATGDAAGLNADAATLALGLNAGPEHVIDRLRTLQEASILVYRRYKSGYQIWDGSDLDLDELISKAAADVFATGGFAERVQQLVPAFPVVGARHYHQTGTLRYLDARYASPEAILHGAGERGDGTLLYIIPDRVEQLHEAEQAARVPDGKGQKLPLVVVLPGEERLLLDATMEVLSIDHVAKYTPALDGDPVARRELEARRGAAQEALTGALARSFAPGHRGARWFVRGEERPVNGRPSTIASEIFDRTFHAAPRIINELVNREELSSAAAAARHTLLRLLLTETSHANLGIEGHPPELSIYRSVMLVLGLHGEKDGVWGLREPENTGPQKLFKMLDGSVNKSTAGRKVSFDALLEKMARPPFGIRRGVALILAFVWFRLREDALFLYEDGALVPVIAGDLVHRLLRNPGQFEVQSSGGQLALSVVHALAEPLHVRHRGAEPGLFDVVRSLLSVLRALSAYTLQTQQVGREARRVRAALQSAKDPVALLTTELPDALNLPKLGESQQATEINTFASALLAALRELQAADHKLELRIAQTLQDLLRFGEDDDTFFAAVRRSGEVLLDHPSLEPKVRQWVNFSANLEHHTADGRREWILQVATLVRGKNPRSWADSDMPLFAQGAMELCRSVLAAEELALEQRKIGDSSFHMIRVSVLDSTGRDHSGVAMLRPRDGEQVARFREELRILAMKHGISGRELAYAVIADMMKEFEQSPEERGNDE